MPRQKSFSNMALDELVAKRDQIEKAIAQKVIDERKELEMRLAALAGYYAEGDVGRRGPGRPRGSVKVRNGGHPLAGRKVAIKYRGPNGETWSGRGLAPRWLAALEAKGKKRDKFLVS